MTITKKETPKGSSLSTEEIIAQNTVDIHGKNYLTVAGRVQLAHKLEKLSINTEVIAANGQVVVKATVTTDKGTFTGISAANPAKSIEKMSPYEVAETSAVGRALGFAGFGAIESIATADEMIKAGATTPVAQVATPRVPAGDACPKCGSETAIAAVAGPSSSRPGASYLKCASCGQFLRFTSEIN